MFRMRVWPLGLALLTSILVGCPGDPTAFTGFNAQHFLVAAGLAQADVEGSFDSSAPPSAGSGPAAEVDISGAMIPGGSQFVTVTSSSSFDQIIVAIEDHRGFYRINLPQPVTSVALSLVVAEDPPATSFDLQIAAVSGGTVGPYNTTPVALLDVGTGDVQVSVSWDAPSDVDLHVVDPSGEEIYYGNSSSASGGALDLDANAACNIDSPPVNQENITWETAPAGDYIVRLDYWDSCGVPETNYIVVVRVEGQRTRTFRGTFTGPGDHGGAGDGRLITEFTF